MLTTAELSATTTNTSIASSSVELPAASLTFPG